MAIAHGLWKALTAATELSLNEPSYACVTDEKGIPISDYRLCYWNGKAEGGKMQLDADLREFKIIREGVASYIQVNFDKEVLMIPINGVFTYCKPGDMFIPTGITIEAS